MIILDKPYVSEFLKDTLVRYQFPVLKNKSIEVFNISPEANLWDEKFAVEEIKRNKEK